MILVVGAVFEITTGFLGGLLIGCGIAWVVFRRRNGYSGTIKISQTADKKVFSLELNHPPEELESKKKAIFKIEAPE